MRVSELKNISQALIAQYESAHKDQKDTIVRNFVYALGARGKSSLFRKWVPTLERLIQKRDGIKKISIETADELTPKMKEHYQDFFLKHFSTRFNIVYVKNKDLIGGVRIKIDDYLVDASLLGRVQQLKQLAMNN